MLHDNGLLMTKCYPSYMKMHNASLKGNKNCPILPEIVHFYSYLCSTIRYYMQFDEIEGPNQALQLFCCNINLFNYSYVDKFCSEANFADILWSPTTRLKSGGVF